MSLRQQLQDIGKKLVGAHHYNKDGSVNNRQDFSYDTHYGQLFYFYFCLCLLSTIVCIYFSSEWNIGIMGYCLSFAELHEMVFMIMSGLYWVFLFNYCNTCLRVY